MKKFLYRSFIELAGNRALSRVLSHASGVKSSRRLIQSFAHTFQVNKEEAALTLHDYDSLHSFFTRSLVEGSRTINHDPSQLISPVDAVLGAQGNLDAHTAFQLKGQTYTLEKMLGRQNAKHDYAEGSYFVFYLSPAHYHRIHAPYDGAVRAQKRFGSKSAPVNPAGLKMADEPLSRNYRVVTEFETDAGPMALVKVGALNVNSILLTAPENEWKRGQEVGYFAFGSTVVLLTGRSVEAFHCEEGEEIHMGSSISQLNL
ncbi:phosphatidylserine decarboxylase [Salsuginibacillus halophilus]|uniref:phosphatidylserine decarboxylase n=1 Tax=Salsuginibacillus halophilus TaxID=517424 RepID=A0A2P8HFS3_9BACI|nr:archaetidylserine decarboxylase [Salsuginibacillus halophilus]PSL45067.1 phosphatidylserine decarboxylase [Salsuginibacillus halophilus]